MNAAVKTAGAALADAVDAARAADPEQLDLVGMPSRFEAGGMSPAKGGQLRLIAAAGRRGRPPGATNLATRDVKDYCRRLFGFDPMVEGFRWLQHTPETLADVLGCTRLEAFDRLEGIRRSLMPVFYANQAPVDETGKAVPTFAVQIGAVNVGAASSAPPWQYAGGPVIDGEQNQEVSTGEISQSHDGQSHGDGK